MVSENDRHCYTTLMCDENKEQKEQLEQKLYKEETAGTVNKMENPAESKCNILNEPGSTEHSERTDDNTGGKSDIRSNPSKTGGKKKDEKQMEASNDNIAGGGESETKCETDIKDPLEESTADTTTDPMNDEAQHSETKDTTTGEETKSASTESKDKTVGEVKHSVEIKGNVLTEQGGAEHSEKTDDNIRSEAEKKGSSETEEEDEKQMEASNDNIAGGGGESETKCETDKKDPLEESTADTKPDPMNDEAQHSETKDTTTGEETKSASTESKDKTVGEVKHSVEIKGNVLSEPDGAEIKVSSETEEEDEKQMEASNDNIAGGGGESETKCETDKKVQLEESTADTTPDPMNDEAQHSETKDTTTGEETKSASTESKDKTVGEVKHSVEIKGNVLSEPDGAEIKVSSETEEEDEKQMEASNDNIAGGGGESETKCETDKKVQLEESTADTTPDPMNDEAQHSETKDTTTGEETKSASTESKDKTVGEVKHSVEIKGNVLTEQGGAEHSEKTDGNIRSEAEIKVSSETEKKDEKQMEASNDNIAGGGEESETKCETDKRDPLEESTADTTLDSMNDEAQHSETKDTRGETKSASAERKDKMEPELTLVLIGDTNSIEIGPKNILLEHDEPTNVEHFSSKLYDLCGRHISVINRLGFPNIHRIPLNQGIHAFVLLLPNGLHVNHYHSAVQRLEKAFGKDFLSYVMTIVTHELDETCESALEDFKDFSSFAEQRFHTCRRSMTDEKEMIDLLEKIDVMVSENDRHCYTTLMCNGNKEQKEQLEQKLYKEETTGTENMDHSSETKCNALNEAGGAEHSETTHDDTAGDAELMSSRPETKEKEDSDRQTCQGETETLFRRLHLQYQQKLSPADFLKIGPPVKTTQDISEKDFPNTFLQRVMVLDYRARYIPERQGSPDLRHSQSVESDDDDLDALFGTTVDVDESKQTNVHPMDVQMAVFHCSDSFLKQNMITKLSQCQYALPFLVPNPETATIECPLWTFRQIIKTWKTTQVKDDSKLVTMKSMPICNAETHMVSFFRLGSLSESKSQLMNSLINDRHNTFFHRNCPGSTKFRHLMDGVAEIAWYCPAGKPNDSFPDCIAFCNLHGDALMIEKQTKILTETSSVNVVLVPTLEKRHRCTTVISDLYKSQKPLIILIADNDCDSVRMKQGKYKMGLKDRSQSDVSKTLKGIIGNMLSGLQTSFQLKSMANVSGIRVDEDDPVCRKGGKAAMEIFNLIQGMDISKIKDRFLPCQGQLWHQWSRIKKELYHLKGNVEKEKSQKNQQLMKIREDQCSVSSSELMKSFTESLISLSSQEKEYFLKWMQILIDALSTDDLSSILQSYDEKWSEVLVLKKKHPKSPLLIGKQDELETISKKLQSATFGLEHIFREMGQIYEAHQALKKQPNSGQTNWSKYPKLAADLMISGRPMELMDGDAGHVPLMWISSVLEEVIKNLGDQRVFVLSVLGVQSSGKSTMLNAMFGLQFAVSAGRCTKGAFMQLVKVSEEIQKDFRFDYVLVVDTEGLRALELAGNATHHHKNALATFVVGLGNMTLINIFGENPAEMQDVLQIVVQAFMRMKKVKLSPSCVFVHQNVTDIGAAEKNMDGKRRLQEKLDQMAQLAAKEEVCDVECFSDIIEFDVQQDVKYFAQLWEGSPPMAPPNPGYSESVQELKSMILTKASHSAGITLSHFKSKIQDLWNALMNEQFVFSFKNTLEIAAYRKLEVQYGNWTWNLRSSMLTIENQLYTRIENGKLDTIDPNDLTKELRQTYEKIKKDMMSHFEDNRDKDMLVQWRSRFENKIKEFHGDQVKEVKRKLDDVIQQKKACKKLDDKKPEFENKLLQKSKELAQQLKDKAKDEEELQKHFNSVWTDWVNELTEDIKPIEDINLEEDQMFIFEELGIEQFLINESNSSGRYKNVSKAGNYCAYITHKKYPDLYNEIQKSQESKIETSTHTAKKEFSAALKAGLDVAQHKLEFCSTTQQNIVPHEEQEMIRTFINNIEQQSFDAIKTKPVATRGYSPTYLQEVAKNVQEDVTKFESERNYSFNKEFTVDVLLYVFEGLGSWLSDSHKTFKKNNDALTYLNNNKPQYYNVLRSFCKGNSSAVVFGEMICDKLKVSTVEAVCNKTAIDLAKDMRCSFPAFSGNRLDLEKHVLKSLAVNENFDDFINYIRHPRRQVETFIKEEVEKYIFREHEGKAQNILKKNIDDISQLVRRALFEATERVKTQGGDTEMWVNEFSSFLKDELPLDTICCKNFSDINNFDFLKEEIEKGLVNITEDMNHLSLDKMKEFRLRPDQILIDQLCKCCWETCPFCGAVCINTLEDHSPDDHSVPFHRSSAINGWHFTDTDIMSVDFCTTKVASDRNFRPDKTSEDCYPYKQYREAGPRYANWRITPDESKLKYWTWFVCRFKKELEDYYKLKFKGKGEIPSKWKTHTKEEAIQSLHDIVSETK
ncbi:interferon-induced very large GTPase 1-like isoform X3 [Mugil cephalus]|uniref:interferon-induced very large GTPase 1-like isoform X3 n=1 Tax=Mugil cephalus TaxID=48193 RepID=UPI001FB6826D|nr:interferon-induced very large GTPase 1-like isoform X3 [Mugil cephalus]